VVLSN
jgi:hypothetical protein